MSASHARLARQNCTLTRLSLRGNRVNNFGATRLAEALARNTTLLQLDLAENHLLQEWLVSSCSCDE